MSKKKPTGKIIFIIILVLVVAGTAIYLKYSDKEEVIEVRTEEIERRTITQRVNAIGTLKPETEVKISSETSGEIINLPVMEGDTVEKGDLLAKIKPDIVETQLEQYKAALDGAATEIDYQKSSVDRAKSEFDRVKELFEKDYVSKQDLDRAKAQYNQAQSQYQNALSRYEQAKASLKQIQRNADRTTIKSPIDGIVTSLNVESGEKVLGTAQNIGTEMMNISDLSTMNSIVQVDENDIVLISVGDTARVEIDAFSDEVFIGIVKEIGHSAKVMNTGSQDQVTNFEVKIRLLKVHPKMRPGMSCKVDIETETRKDVIAAPLKAVTVRGKKVSDINDGPKIRKKGEDNENSSLGNKQQTVVFAVDKELVKMLEVETGISDEGYIEITEGLEEGQEIVSGSFSAISKQLNDGSKIKVNNERNTNRGGRR